MSEKHASSTAYVRTEMLGAKPAPVSQTGLLTYVYRIDIDPFEGFAADYAVLVRDSPALTAYEG